MTYRDVELAARPGIRSSLGLVQAVRVCYSQSCSVTPTLIDYNWKQSTIGIGVTLNDWL